MASRETGAVGFYAPFHVPPTTEFKDFVAFLNQYSEVERFAQRQREKAGQQQEQELDRKQAELAKLEALLPRVIRIVKAVLRDKITPKEAGRRLRAIAPDESARRWVHDFLGRINQPKCSPEEIAAEEKKIAADEKALNEDKRTTRATATAQRGISTLAKRGIKGNRKAIESLVDLATDASIHLLLIEKAHPDTARSIARAQDHWPVVLRAVSDWEEQLQKQFDDLQIGADFPPVRSRFRKARGADANYAARRWAQAAVRTLEQTRLQILLLVKEKDAFMELSVRKNWRLTEMPSWVMNAVKLSPFSSACYRAWASVIREMIREQMPDFHTHPDWSTQRNTAKQSGRDSKGEIQSAILDDIGSALKTIAPPPPLPKSAC